MKKYYFWFQGKCYETLQESERQAERYFSELIDIADRDITVFTLEEKK